MKEAQKSWTITEIVSGYSVGMLTTRTATGQLKGRPLALATTTEPNLLWMVGALDTNLMDNLTADPRVAISLQGSTRMVTIHGKALATKNDDRTRALWSEAWRPWFPEGPKSDLMLVSVHCNHAEMWDANGGAILDFLTDAGTALLQGRTPTETPVEHVALEL